MVLAVGGLRADAELAARDRALPGLEVLLDDARLTAALGAALPEAELQAARATYLRYKPGHACVVACRLTLDDGDVDAYVRLERPEARAKLTARARRARSQRAPCSCRG